MNEENMFKRNASDPIWRSIVKNNCFLRSYQADALRNIFDAVMSGQGGRFAVMSAAMAVFENGSLSVHNSSDFERWAKHMDEIKRINQERIRKLRGYW